MGGNGLKWRRTHTESSGGDFSRWQGMGGWGGKDSFKRNLGVQAARE